MDKPLELVYMIDKVEVGHTFRRSEWPLHVTFVPWFHSEDFTLLEATLKRVLKHTKPFTAKINGEKMFGARKDVQVNILMPSTKLQKLHDRLVAAVKAADGELISERYTGELFRPHVTHFEARGRRPGKLLNINNIHLVSLINSANCRVIQSYEFQQRL